jgi:hypothetical protein
MKKDELEHFEYEIDMLFNTFILVCDAMPFYFEVLYRGEEIKNIMTNALIESYCMHFRVLHDFLFVKDNRDFSLNAILEPRKLKELKDKLITYESRSWAIKKEVSNRVAHLDKSRNDLSNKEFLGNFVESINVIIELYDIVLNYVENDKLVEKYKKYKARIQRIDANNRIDRITTNPIRPWF